jgi:glycine/sarcosine N-methyltransferase
MPADPISGFYDEFAPHYHLMFEDWEASMTRQAAAISAILEAENAGRCRLRLLDCACGIGTQALGLAKLGYRVTGSDLSVGAIRRARREASLRNLTARFHVADMRQLDRLATGGFEAVICMDNALPHLLSDTDITEAVQQIRARLRPKGTLLASIRDYDQLVRDRPAVQGPAFYSHAGQRRVVSQLWDWSDDRRYTLHLYITEQTPSGWTTVHSATMYRAILREEITAILQSSGFGNVRWLLPIESGFYQPVIVATAIE